MRFKSLTVKNSLILRKESEAGLPYTSSLKDPFSLLINQSNDRDNLLSTRKTKVKNKDHKY